MSRIRRVPRLLLSEPMWVLGLVVLDDDMAQIMLAVLTALQDERDRAVAEAAGAGAGAEPG